MLAFATIAAEKTLKVLPDGTELMWGTIFFLILFAALAKFVFPKVRETLDKRR